MGKTLVLWVVHHAGGGARQELVRGGGGTPQGCGCINIIEAPTALGGEEGGWRAASRGSRGRAAVVGGGGRRQLTLC